jgi:hypothetical protein
MAEPWDFVWIAVFFACLAVPREPESVFKSCILQVFWWPISSPHGGAIGVSNL